MAIKDWPEQDRPREKMQAHGPGALTDSELLAIFLRTGTPGTSAVELGRALLARFGSLSNLFAASLEEFSSVKGLGVAKHAQLRAVFELARRALSEQLQSRDVLDSPDKVKDFLRLTFHARTRECFSIVFLDSQHRAIALEELFAGTLAQAPVYPREVVRRVLSHNAAAVILAHNHPSGVAKPSRADEHLTRSLKAILEQIEVRVLDHIIVGAGAAFSFAENGLL
ncbi:MAG: DNA repair protein RadC [Betaproteobacteria bacterium]|jgi:DNA repair protein RadC